VVDSGPQGVDSGPQGVDRGLRIPFVQLVVAGGRNQTCQSGATCDGFKATGGGFRSTGGGFKATGVGFRARGGEFTFGVDHVDTAPCLALAQPGRHHRLHKVARHAHLCAPNRMTDNENILYM
jgi:hypothetical protein